MCTPGMGVNLSALSPSVVSSGSNDSRPKGLWGESHLYVNPINVLNIVTKIRAEGKGGTERVRLNLACQGVGKPESEPMSRRTETAYKATSKGKLAPFDSAHALSLPNGHDIKKPWIRETCLPKGR